MNIGDGPNFSVAFPRARGAHAADDRPPIARAGSKSVRSAPKCSGSIGCGDEASLSCAVYALPQAPIFRLVAAVFTCCVLATGVNPTNGTQAREAPRSASSGSAPHEEQLAGAIEEIWKKSQILRP